MKAPKPQNPFSDMTPAQLRKESAIRVASLCKLESRMRDEGSFEELEPAKKRLEAERRLIEATLSDKVDKDLNINKH